MSLVFFVVEYNPACSNELGRGELCWSRGHLYNNRGDTSIFLLVTPTPLDGATWDEGNTYHEVKVSGLNGTLKEDEGGNFSLKVISGSSYVPIGGVVFSSGRGRKNLYQKH